MGDDPKVLVRASGLTKYYPVPVTRLFEKRKQIHAAENVDLTILEGQTLGLVGESGCGKSTVGRLLAGIEKPTSGNVFYRGEDLSGMSPSALKKIRTQIQMIFQDPYASLNPRKRIREILTDPGIAHGLIRREDAAAEAARLLELVGLPKSAAGRFPHEFSGGQRQRITIARALSLKPSLIICDEPVSALDMSIQAQVLNLLRDLQKDLGVSYLFIAHGLGTVHYVSDRTAVMYLGQIVEEAPSDELFRAPLHPYAKTLIASVPIADPDKRTDAPPASMGEIPSAADPPSGCRFHDRCPLAGPRCRTEAPRLLPAGDRTGDHPEERGHLVACHAVEEAGKEKP